MTSLMLLEIPELDEARPAWLEQQLVGTRLAALVQQLRFVKDQFVEARSSAIVAEDLDSLLGDDREAVLKDGLEVLGDERLHTLLQNPEWLLPLQELVLVQGSSYWIDLANRVADETVSGAATKSTSEAVPQRVSLSVASDTSQLLASSTRRTWFWAALATAAMVLVIASVVINRSNDKPSGWGFSNPDLFVSSATPGEYLQTLAGAANQWFDKPIPDSQALQKRLNEFSEGCSMLIAAQHEPLDDTQRAWLVDKCREWKGKIDQLASQLAANEIAFDTASAEADALATRMVAVLEAESRKA